MVQTSITPYSLWLLENRSDLINDDEHDLSIIVQRVKLRKIDLRRDNE